MANKINNYNQFLLHLDEKQRKIDYWSNKMDEDPKNGLKNEGKNEGENNEKKEKKSELEKEIEDLLKVFMDEFEKNNLNTSNYAGYQKENDPICKSIVNPNLYIDTIFTPVIKFGTASRSSLTNDNESIKKFKPKKIDFEKEKISVPSLLITIELENDINTLEDLMNFIRKYPLNPDVKYNINMRNLHDILPYLEDLDAIIGMKELKKNIIDQILYFVQEFYKDVSVTTVGSPIKKGGNQDFLHTVIYGPPGTGKTEIAKIIGKIYSKIGILSKGTFTKVTRSELIAGYLGQTAIKTKEVIQDSLGGVLFIDEAYALGNQEKRDSFSKECIDTLCEAMSDHKDNWMVIIAGYEEDMRNCFFSYNQGLESRFTWRFKTDMYVANDLYLIFLKKVKDIGWSIKDDSLSKGKIDVAWFEKNKGYFKYYGRDIETLLSRVKIVHSKRVFCKGEGEKRKMNYQDLEKGLEMFLKNDDIKNRREEEDRKKMVSFMYV